MGTMRQGKSFMCSFSLTNGWTTGLIKLADSQIHHAISSLTRLIANTDIGELIRESDFTDIVSDMLDTINVGLLRLKSRHKTKMLEEFKMAVGYILKEFKQRSQCALKSINV